MWVEGGDIQDELFDQLAAVLTAPDELVLTPSVAELEALAAAVAARWPDGASAPVHHIRTAGSHPLRRLGSSAWRALSTRFPAPCPWSTSHFLFVGWGGSVTSPQYFFRSDTNPTKEVFALEAPTPLSQSRYLSGLTAL